jgi:hypothetical protein
MLIDLQNFPTGVSGERKQDFPTDFQMKQNYPNPFNSGTTIQFTLPFDGRASVTIFNVLGQEVKTLMDGVIDSGDHTLFWDGTDGGGKTVGSGVYFCTINTGPYHQSRKMIVLR